MIKTQIINILFKTSQNYFFRYFHKVPAEAPQLELKASYGLAEPIPFELPPLSEQCTAEVYATFDLTRGAKNDKVLLPPKFMYTPKDRKNRFVACF